MPSNPELLKVYHKLLKIGKIKKDPFLENLLQKKKIRSLSGVAVITVLTKPYSCQGKCIFCPFQEKIPKSYLEKEPAVQRAQGVNFDPYLQTKKRIEALQNCGHLTEKIDLIILGGTFSFYPKRYQSYFIKKVFEACNEKTSSTLKEAQKINEKAKHRIIGITIETRPDCIDIKEIKWLRKLGVTRVELGVQTVFEEILKLNQRGHGVKETIKATQLLKDAGFKVNYHMMVNLYGSDFEKDLQAFKIIFEDERFKPDYLKIYPCVVLKEAPLHKLYLEGKYRPYSTEKLVELLIEIKKRVPYWVRIQRVIRDIPSTYIVAGNKITNLREVVKKEMEKRNLTCHCIRCRQAESLESFEKIYLFREDYWSSSGKEIFLSFESKDRKKLFSFLRLRIPSFYFSGKKHFIEVLNDSAIIRELHTYGKTASLFEKEKENISYQHKGLGKKLIKEAERIAKEEFKVSKIAVISGVGVRDYYRKLGYRLKETYMVKKL